MAESIYTARNWASYLCCTVSEGANKKENEYAETYKEVELKRKYRPKV
jgi:hypothetical protein